MARATIPTKNVRLVGGPHDGEIRQLRGDTITLTIATDPEWDHDYTVYAYDPNRYVYTSSRAVRAKQH